MPFTSRTIPLTLDRAFVVEGFGEIPARSHVVVNAERRSDDPRGLSDGFDITADLYEPSGTWSGAACRRNGRDIDAGGCLHDIVLEIAPGLAPLVAVHGADLEGTPMHVASNATYFYFDRHEAYELKHYGPEYVKRHGTGHERAARVLGVELADLPQGLEHGAFAAFVADQAERWRWESHDAAHLLELLPDVCSLRGYDMRGNATPVVPLPAGVLAAGVRVDI